jgi:hypothetical protein
MKNDNDNNPYHESLPSKMKKIMMNYHPINNELTSTNSKIHPTLKLSPNVIGDTFSTSDIQPKHNNFISNEKNSNLEVSSNINLAEKVNITKRLASFILILNIFFPGIGTITASFYDKSNRVKYIKYGILQLLTFYILVGWVWAILFASRLLVNVQNN